jgi:AcrR family transcriptional regulator
MTEQGSKSAGTEQPSAATSNRQPRFNRDERQADLLKYAAQEVLDQGGFPISFERLAGAANVSKALIYNYFPNQHILGSTLLNEALGGVDRGALRQAVAQPDLLDAARACALAYFELVSRQGPLLHLLLADAFLEQGTDRKAFGRAAMLLLPLMRRLKRDLRLSSREATVIVQLLITVPEEAGRKVFQGDVDPELARRLCGETIVASLAALDGQTPDHLAGVAAGADFL